jgi:hypothetical protein
MRKPQARCALARGGLKELADRLVVLAALALPLLLAACQPGSTGGGY